MSAPPHLRRNFWMHCLEGGFYMAGLAFISQETVLPTFVKELGGKANLIALMPVLLPAMFSTLGLFVAPFIERMHHFKTFVILFGLMQRLPYLVAGLVMLLAPQAAGAILYIVVLTPLVSGLVGSIGVPAWMEMVTRMIPEHLRASGWAIRYVIQGVFGLSAGLIIHWILTHHPGAIGYAWLHLICFAFLILSWLSQVFMIETDVSRPAIATQPSYKEYLLGLPLLLRHHPSLIKLIFARFTSMGYLMLVSFMSIHALKITERPNADMGHLVLANMIGALCGNVFAGWWGNRHGGHAIMLLSRFICLALSVALLFVQSFDGFLLAFFFWGFGYFVDRVGDLTLSAELCPFEGRPIYQSILGFCQMLCLITAVTMSGWLYRFTQSFHAVIILSGVFAAASILILRTIPEARKRKGERPMMGENPPMV